MSNGKMMEFGRNKYEPVSRGGKGYEAVKRLSFVRVVPPPIELVDWDQVEAKNGNGHRDRENGTNGQEQGRLFGEADQ
jgi:hypothetical protein